MYQIVATIGSVLIINHICCDKYQGIYDGMTLDEIKKMAPEEHKVIEEHPFNYRYPRGEVNKCLVNSAYYFLLTMKHSRGRNKKFFHEN